MGQMALLLDRLLDAPEKYFISLLTNIPPFFIFLFLSFAGLAARSHDLAALTFTTVITEKLSRVLRLRQPP